MNNVVVNQRSFYKLHVNAIVRPAIAFIALDQRASRVAMDLDAVVAVAAANFVV